MSDGVPVGERIAVEATIRGRRSVRRFLPEPVPLASVQAILDAACWAPSPHNSQPWRFVAIISAAARQRLANEMAAQWASDLRADGLGESTVWERVSRRRDRIALAPAAVLICLTTDGLDAYPDARRQLAEWATAVQSLGAAVQNLLLAAHARGLGGCWMCAPIFCPEVVRQALHLDSDWEPQALVLLGYPERSPDPKPRRGVGELAIFR